MKVSGLTSFAWLVLIAVYGLRVFFASVPGGEILWKAGFRGETGLLDRAEAILWVPVIVCNVLAFLATYRRQGLSLTALWYLGMGVLCVFLLGEEVSWGQHVFGFQASERMVHLNAQHESNLHNLNLALMLDLPPTHPLYPWLTNFNHILNPAYYLACCILFIAFPVLKRELGWRIVAWIPTPSARIVRFFATNVLAYLVVDKFVFDVGEIFELAITTTFALTALQAYRRTRSLDSKPDPRVTARIIGLDSEPAAPLEAGHTHAARGVAIVAGTPAYEAEEAAPTFVRRRRSVGRGTLLRPSRKHGLVNGPVTLYPVASSI